MDVVATIQMTNDVGATKFRILLVMPKALKDIHQYARQVKNCF